MKNTPAKSAAEFDSLCRQYGWQPFIGGGYVGIRKRITPGSLEELTNADMEYGSILDAAPLKGGSVWGTECGGMGAVSALNSGVFTMKKSGTGKRFLAELAKFI